jgi:Ser/Thr protein kinase RdoA (MazF antagonist)
LGAAHLTRDQVQSILSLYHLEGPDAFGDLPVKSTCGNQTYWVHVDGLEYVLRLVQRRTVDDMLHEKELLLHVERAGLAVPRLMQNVARGSFTPWARRGRFVSLFRYPPGRRLGRFEVRPRHVAAVAGWLARLHRVARDFTRRRPLPDRAFDLDGTMTKIETALQRRRLAQRHRTTADVFRSSLARFRAVDRASVPHGILHGRPGLAAARFQGGRLTGLVDLSDAGAGPWLHDLAFLIQAWCWRPAADQRGGPAGAFDADLIDAAVDAYGQERPLTSEERRWLPTAVRWVSLHEAMQAFAEHEWKRRPRRVAPFRDFRHHLARLKAPWPESRPTLRVGGAPLVGTQQGS